MMGRMAVTMFQSVQSEDMKLAINGISLLICYSQSGYCFYLLVNEPQIILCAKLH